MGGWWGPCLPLSSRTSATRPCCQLATAADSTQGQCEPDSTHFFSLLRSFLTHAVSWCARLLETLEEWQRRPRQKAGRGDGWSGRGWEGQERGWARARATMKKKHASLIGVSYGMLGLGRGPGGRGRSSQGSDPFPCWLQTGHRLCLPSCPFLSPARATPVLPPVHLALCTRAPAARGLPARPPGCQAVSFWMVLL